MRKNESTKTNARDYWKATAKSWNQQYYGDKKRERSLLSRLTRNPPETVHFRQRVILDHLEQHIQGKRVVEFGCGTGLLSQEIIQRGARSYHGYDLAQSVIDIALENIETSSFGDRITFSCVDLESITSLNADFVLSAGLTTWITLEQINHMFAISRELDFLHAISEPRLSLRYMLRALHQSMTPTESYQGKLKKVSNVTEIAKKHGWENFHVFRHRKLSSVACLSSLPFPESLGPFRKISV